jgi:hypothetical protein
MNGQHPQFVRNPKNVPFMLTYKGARFYNGYLENGVYLNEFLNPMVKCYYSFL